MNHAQSLRQDDARQCVATVTASSDDRHALQTSAGSLTARRAASCLLAPAPGDRVLVAVTAEASYILAVLERGEAPARVELPRDASLTCPGELAIEAKEGVKLRTGGVMSLLSQRLELRALDAGIALDRLTLVGRYLQAELTKVRAMSETVDTVADRLSQRVRRHFRRVDELEQVRARQIDTRVEGTLALHAENAMLAAKKLVKVDGDQIHMG